MGNHALRCAVSCNAPAHAATSAVQEVLNSTAGPPQEGMLPGAQKGRGDNHHEWDAQQRLLDEARKQFDCLPAQIKLRGPAPSPVVTSSAASTHNPKRGGSVRGGGSVRDGVGAQGGVDDGAAAAVPTVGAVRGLFSLTDAKWQSQATQKFWQLRQKQFKYEQELGVRVVVSEFEVEIKSTIVGYFHPVCIVRYDKYKQLFRVT